MEEDQSHVSQKIWSLHLEITCLLTGETFPVLSGDHVTMAVSPPSSWTLERLAMQKILEISNKISELLMGEVPIRCRDVAVGRSMKEQKWLEEPQDLYTNTKVADQPTLQPLYSQDLSQEGDLSPDHYQTGIKEEEEEELVAEAPDHTGIIIKMEPSSCPATPERPPLGEFGDGVEVEETVVWSDDQSVGEESSPVIGEGSQHVRRISMMTPETSYCKTEDTEKRIFSYSLCDNNNIQKLQPDEHEQVNTENSSPCLGCGNCFSCNSKILTPERMHAGQKLYSCSECGKYFARKSNLVIHERVHTGEKPFSCSECGKCFSVKSDVIKHKRVHTGEKPYSCSECGKCFSMKSDLMKHERVHTGVKPYACAECGKCFSQKSALSRHDRIHTGVKPYSCEECGKCFSQKSTLAIHRIVHGGVKPFSCSECGKCFIRKSVLLDHQKIHNHRRIQPIQSQLT